MCSNKTLFIKIGSRPQCAHPYTIAGEAGKCSLALCPGRREMLEDGQQSLPHPASLPFTVPLFLLPPPMFAHVYLSHYSCPKRFWEADSAPTLEVGLTFSSIAQSCLTLSDPMNCSTPGLPLHHQLPELAQIHVHQVGDAIQPSHLCRPLLLPSIFPSIRVFSNESKDNSKSFLTMTGSGT